jgi:hypothetical protein
MESFEMPGYVPSPKSLSVAQVPVSSQSRTASLTAIDTSSSIPTDSALLQVHHLNSTQSANAAAALDGDQANLKQGPEILLASTNFDIVQMQSSSSALLRSTNPSDNAKPSSDPVPAAAAASLDDNPALRFGRDDDPSVIK